MTALRSLQHTYELEVIVPDGQENKAEIEKIAREQIAKRLISMTFKDSMEGQQELTLVLENSDLYFIDDAVLFGDKIFQEGNKIRFRYGYIDPDRLNDTDNLSPNRIFTSVGLRNMSRDTVTFVAISDGQQQLGSVSTQRSFPPSKISSIVDRILKDEGGFSESKQRIIQDSEEIREGIIQRAGETNLAFIYRLAGEINYYFYITDPSGTPTAHFHKSGFAAAQTEIDTTNVDVTPRSQKSATLTEGVSGNFAQRKGFITYRPPDEASVSGGFGPLFPESEVINFSMRFTPNARAISTTGKGVDIKEGAIVDEKVRNSDLISNSLSPSGVTIALDDAADIQAVVNVDLNTGDQTKEEARNQAAAKLEQNQLGTVEFSITVLGNQRIEAGDIWGLVGFKKFDGDYLAKETTHTVSSSNGYMTVVMFSSDGVGGADSQNDGRPARDFFPNLLVQLNDAPTGSQEIQVVDLDKKVAQKIGKPEDS